ncbi:hypothetical protein ACI2KC_13005 [Pseudomonas monteilii]
MSLSEEQLSRVECDMDKNHREVLIFAVADLMMPGVGLQAAGIGTQSPQVCSRRQADVLSGVYDPVKSVYDATVHEFVNTNAGVPLAMSTLDLKNIVKMARDLGGIGTKARISVRNGKQYVILSGYPGLRRALNGTRYSIRNAEIVEMGIGRYGIRGSALSGFRLSCYVSVGIEAVEWFFNDESVWSDLFAGVGVELVKAGIASAIGYAAALAVGSVFTLAAAPAIAGAAVVLAIGWGLNALDNHYGIKNSVKAGLRYAVDHIQALQEQLAEIKVDDLRKYAEQSVAEIANGIAEQLYDEAKSWVLRKLQPGDLNLPGWPRPELPNMPSLPKLPKLPTFNLPGF